LTYDLDGEQARGVARCITDPNVIADLGIGTDKGQLPSVSKRGDAVGDVVSSALDCILALGIVPVIKFLVGEQIVGVRTLRFPTLRSVSGCAADMVDVEMGEDHRADIRMVHTDGF